MPRTQRLRDSGDRLEGVNTSLTALTPSASPEPRVTHFHPPVPKPRTGLTLRHKLMLLAALEILVAGFTQAQMKPYRAGITVEIPALPDHVIV
ncbi:hypothetical protein [uncultured Methylobacterium sp.]|uniref:hypothetical protein n=1 Tax=uncultured Methylobacterium sp. TaxID=157278 RepID=UPI0035CC8E88